MVKKNKEQVPNPSAVTNREILQRLSFTYQASAYLNSIPVSTVTDGSRKRKRTTAHNLSKRYIDSMKIVGQKTTVKMDPSIKRTLCKGCNVVLMPGSTCTVRVKSKILSLSTTRDKNSSTESSSHGHIMSYTCTSCGTGYCIPAPATLTQETTMKSARLPPLFARPDAGHVVFRGLDEVVTEKALSFTSFSRSRRYLPSLYFCEYSAAL
ncbi:RNAse P Rpr2/Rpp21/SNM1 subunit domain-containing protein [Mycena floridula]|nr:RNAse P Rpr2/Rpp21/SNM1 subunit domain-containing protein [Mycena floridula]